MLPANHRSSYSLDFIMQDSQRQFLQLRLLGRITLNISAIAHSAVPYTCACLKLASSERLEPDHL